MKPVLLTSLVAIALLVGGFAALVALVWARQERIVFQPPQVWEEDSVRLSRVDYEAADGQPLFAYVARPDGGAAPRGVLVAFHGNADLARWWVEWAEEVVRRTGWMVVVPEYRGYAGLPGAPTYEGSRLDARAAYAVVRDSLAASPAQVAIFGHSLGSAIGSELATETRPRALILQSPFTSARAMARIVVARPVVALWRVISRVHYDTETGVRSLDAPVHVAHGDRDLIVPVRMGRAVHAAAQTRGTLLVVRGAGHNNVSDVGGGEYWRWLEGALADDAR